MFESEIHLELSGADFKTSKIPANNALRVVKEKDNIFQLESASNLYG